MAAAPREIRFQRAFTADGIPEEHGEKVDHLIAPKAPPCKAHPLTDLGQNALLPQVLNEQSGFAKPGRRREDRLRRGLDDDRSIGDTVHMGLLDERCCILPFQRGTFLSLRARGYISLRIPWAKRDLMMGRVKKIAAGRKLFAHVLQVTRHMYWQTR